MDLKSEYYGDLQHLVDEVYKDATLVTKQQLEIQAEIYDLCEDLLEIVKLLPPGTYARNTLCDQLNSSITGHGWGMVFGTVV